MQAVVHPSRIGSEGKPALYKPPPSKSHFQRVCAAALLHNGDTIVRNPGRSADDAAALHIIEELGAEVSRDDEVVRIVSDGKIRPRNGTIHCHESGLSARLFTAIAAIANTPVEVIGEGSLLQRPMTDLVSALELLGVRVKDVNGCLPLIVHGPVRPRSIVVDGSQSSQIVSGILFALAATAREPVTLQARGLVSRPYLELTCEVLENFDWNVDFDGNETCYISPVRQPAIGYAIVIEPDWSSIAPIVVAAAFAGEIVMECRPASHQADASILDILRKAGAKVDVDAAAGLCGISTAPLQAFDADCTHSPDLVPILAVLATACAGRSSIRGLHRLVHKESDRAKTTSTLLTQLSIRHTIQGDTLLIDGPQTPRSATVQSYNDHRIVMAAAIAALRADGPVTIEGVEAVRKSYPAFFDDLRALGVAVDIIP